MIDLEILDLRTLQKEAARALVTFIDGTNNGLSDINKKCHHISAFGNLPSKAGPGKDIKLVSDKY